MRIEDYDVTKDTVAGRLKKIMQSYQSIGLAAWVKMLTYSSGISAR